MSWHCAHGERFLPSRPLAVFFHQRDGKRGFGFELGDVVELCSMLTPRYASCRSSSLYTKPFGTGELLARIRAALREGNVTQGRYFCVGRSQSRFWQEGGTCQPRQVKLTPTEYDLLKILIHHTDRVLTHHQLIHELWGSTQYQDAVHLLRVTLSHLRRKLHTDPVAPHHILTELGVGYRLKVEHPNHVAHSTPDPRQCLAS